MGYELTLLPLAPVYLLQGRYVRRVTPRLPEAPGPRAGALGAGSELRLLLVGGIAAERGHDVDASRPAIGAKRDLRPGPPKPPAIARRWGRR